MTNLGAITIGIPVGHIERICPTCRSLIGLRGIVRIGGPSIQVWYCPVCDQKVWLESWGREWIVDKVITRGPDPIPLSFSVPSPPGITPDEDRLPDSDYVPLAPKTDWVKIGLISHIGIIGLIVVIKTIKD